MTKPDLTQSECSLANFCGCVVFIFHLTKWAQPATAFGGACRRRHRPKTPAVDTKKSQGLSLPHARTWGKFVQRPTAANATQVASPDLVVEKVVTAQC